MGVAGAAMATLSTQALAAAIGFALLFSGQHGLRPRLADFRPDWHVISKDVQARPAGIGRASHAGIEHDADDASGLQRSARSRSPRTESAFSILTFVVIPAMGLAMATTTLVAQNLVPASWTRAEQTTLDRQPVCHF